MLYQNRISESIELTGDEWLLIKSVYPVLSHFDDLCPLSFAFYSVTLVIGVFDELFGVLGIYGVHNVEKIIPVGKSTFGQLVREVLHEVRRILRLWSQSLCRQLIVHGHVDELDILDGHELLFLCKNLLQEVLIHHGIARKIKLD